jgi:hypothetical protein
MIKNPEIVKQFEDSFLMYEGRLTYDQSMKIFTSMWKEAINFGILPPKDPLEGIEVDIRVAKVLNSCLKNLSPG